MASEPVICPAIMFSDFVIIEAGTAKRSLIGCFSQFNAPRFPWQTRPFFITIFLTNIGPDLDDFELTVRVEDQGTGEERKRVSCRVHRENFSGHALDSTLEIPLPVGPFRVPVPGKMNVIALVNGEELARRHLIFAHLPPPKPPPRPN